jgi:ACT domain-containing protein
MTKRSQTLELKHRVVISNILTRLSKGDTIEQACSNSGVSTSAFYEWRQRGYLDPFVQQVREGLELALGAQVQDKWADVIELLLDDASDKNVSVRDRDQRTRTLLQALGKLGLLSRASDEKQRGPSARDWLAQRQGQFPSVVVMGDMVNVKQQGTADSDEDNVVEGEVAERRPGDYSPRQVNFPVETPVEAP